MYRRAIVPLDGSPFAEAILPFLRQLAGPLDMEVILLRVVAPQPMAPIAEPPGVLIRELETRLRTVWADCDVAESRLAELTSSNEQYEELLAAAHVEIERLGAILDQIYGSRTWKLHLFLERLRGRR